MSYSETGLAPAQETRHIPPRFFLLAAIGSPIIFVLEFFVNGFLRPGYSALRQPISDLALGPWGWVQNMTFEICGVLFIVAACGIFFALRSVLGKVRSRVGLVLLILSGCGLLMGGAFTESVTGHPVAWHDFLHIIGFHMVFDLLSIALSVVGWALCKNVLWRRYGWYTIVTGLLTLLLIFGPYFYNHGRWVTPVGGLLQRIMEVDAFAWYVVVGCRLLTLRVHKAGVISSHL